METCLWNGVHRCSAWEVPFSHHFACTDLIINKFKTVLAKTAVPHSYYHPLQTCFQLPVPSPQQSVLDEHSVVGGQETSGTISPVPGPSSLQDATNKLFIYNPPAESSVTPVQDSKRGGILSTIGDTRVKNLTPCKLKLFKTLQEKKQNEMRALEREITFTLQENVSTDHELCTLFELIVNRIKHLQKFI